MSSTTKFRGDFEEDDDGIDWSEACREIDLVCEASGNLASTSSIPFSEKPKSRFAWNSNAKQSTLDKFVVKSVPKPSSEIPHSSEPCEDKLTFVDIDPEAAKTWIYPVNIPLRDYQFSITKTALFSNTLVALPTGLGKTLIAAVVMYNYFRWFPDGKIVFAAPSRPLVMQQIEACHNIVGIPQEMAIDMTGLTSPSKRACLWESKRVFFVTPQVLEKDIQSGICFTKHLVCLVIDEAHRAMGNYSSSVAVRELMDVPVCLRILALTATPGSKQQAIQQVIDNLRISTLEYRNESDDDVRKYVQNRKIDLIQVAMGQDAVEINEIFSDLMKPYLTKMTDWRIFQHRDDKTLSPCELLTLRDRFRQSPPPNFTNFNSRDAEGYFGLLITLAHMRKLLLCHGIRPAYDMLEEKIKQGSFARYMSRNEDFSKAKLLMQRNLSDGVKSPKISKMLQVLSDHFKTKEPGNSRVIIFSNFRGSVRDIMDALVCLGNCVKATEFIGQSSGKTLKGQSQKVQQAVLEKFRAGGFNVIVATSIGEEGLDIMEVDLVICFDANVSPLRMIQRMGRTGRKHDGRVVVLACEGSEMKGYMRKQASSKNVGKHMRNGGINSFTFHPSPRMVPHIYKPEVQYVEIAIEKFVRSRKKAKDDGAPVTPVLQGKLNDSEKDLISRYFHPPGGIKWKPSLIAFPHFQTFPSRVHNVRHSYKTGLLIDSMQRLQGLSFVSDSRTSLIEDGVFMEKDLLADNVEPRENREDSPEEFLFADDSPKIDTGREFLDYEESFPAESVETKSKDGVLDFSDHNPAAHSCLFESNFISVDSFGNVIILSVPILTLKELSHSENASENRVPISWHMEEVKDKNGQTIESGAVQDHMTPHVKGHKYENLRCNSDSVEDRTTNGLGKLSQTSTRRENLEYRDSVSETPDDELKTSLFHDEDGDDFKDIELSPRLTSMIKSGVVPESPIENNELLNGKVKTIYQVPEPISPAQLHYQQLPKSPVPRRNETASIEIDVCDKNPNSSSIKRAAQIPNLQNDGSASIRGCTSASPIAGIFESPLIDLTNDSGSKNWQLSIEEKLESVKSTRKFKRLRKVGDCENNNLQREKYTLLVTRAKDTRARRGGKRQTAKDEIRAFIDEEAEVSSDGHVSEDEEDSQDNNSHDSFIDDRTCPTNTATQSAAATDMMAVYRRSLLSQSPMPRYPSALTTPSSHSPSVATTRTSETESLHGKQSFSFRSPLGDSANQCFQMNRNSETVPWSTGMSSKTDGRKRKLSFCQSVSVPAMNLEREFQLQHDNDYDDDFFDDIDLDAVEAQATLLLKQKSESLTIQKQEASVPMQPHSPSSDFPSFDLGIDF